MAGEPDKPVDVRSLPGLKERHLIALGDCAICRKPLGESPTFYVVEVSHACFDRAPLQRRIGLGMMIGAPLAAMMGPDEDLAKIVAGPVRVALHEQCGGDIAHIAQLMDREGA
jgi:hypothetical protein